MGRHEDPTMTSINNNIYPQELQIKLYQAFIFSIPILFSIILFLLFYLFYLKRRAANNLASQSARIQLSATNHHSLSFISSGIKGELKDILQLVQFDEELKAKDSLCCVCLGEFEMKEELQQMPLCKHVFHGDCIRHWLQANATCPLCRCPLISPTKICQHSIGLIPNTAHQVDNNMAQQERQGESTESSSNVHSSVYPEEHVIHISEEPSFRISYPPTYL